MSELNTVAGSENVFLDSGCRKAEAQNLLFCDTRTFHVSEEHLRAPA